MTDINAFNQRHPFQFKIEGNHGFKEHIDGLIKEELFDLALEHIKVIRKKYVLARNLKEIPQGRSWVYEHFQEYWEEEEELRNNRQAYPGGITDKVMFELSELKNKVEKLEAEKAEKLKDKKDKIHDLTTPEKGIVLYFLMYHGSGKYKASRDPQVLKNHLKTLGLTEPGKEENGIQVYKKGIVHLMTDADRDDGKRLNKERRYGVFSQKEFHKAIKFLKKKDKKASIEATRTYEEYRNEKLDEDSEGGNDQNYFKDF